MLTYRRTSLLESTAQTLVNTVNCVGVMGKGIAKEFKDSEPEMFAAYKRICDQKLLSPGKLWLWKGAKFWTLNFPTKIHWRNPSKIEWIERGLEKFVASFETLGITEVSFPRLGCGNGGLNWNDVRPVMEKYLGSLPIQIFIHDYTVDVGLPEHMEELAQQLKCELKFEPSYDLFISAIHRAIELGGNDFLEIQTKQPIHASIVADDALKLDMGDATWKFDPEDLWGVWIGLQKGILTKERAAWSRTGGGAPLISLLSVLPNVRPVEIQRMISSHPEIAIEYMPGDRGSAVAPEAKSQLELAWH